MQRIAVWHGTDRALRRLRRATDHNCECRQSEDGQSVTVCSSHAMLLDQKTMDHLASVDYDGNRYRATEWTS